MTLKSIISSASATGLLSVHPKKCNMWLYFSHGDIHACTNTCGAPHVKYLSTFFLDDEEVLIFAILITSIFPTHVLPNSRALFPSVSLLFLPSPEYAPPSSSVIVLFTLLLSWIKLHLTRKIISFLKYSPLLSHKFDFSYSLKLWNSGALMVY